MLRVTQLISLHVLFTNNNVEVQIIKKMRVSDEHHQLMINKSVYVDEINLLFVFQKKKIFIYQDQSTKFLNNYLNLVFIEIQNKIKVQYYVHQLITLKSCVDNMKILRQLNKDIKCLKNKIQHCKNELKFV